MENKDWEEKYQINGLKTSNLRRIEDITNIYGVNPLDIEGYSTLTQENKTIYKRFIINFLNEYTLEARESIKLLSFNYVEEVKYLGDDDLDSDYMNVILHEIYVIKGDGTKELFKRWENKQDKLEIKETINHKYLRFEFETYGNEEWVHVISDEDWY